MTLDRVQDAAQRRYQANRDYLHAIRQARADGHTLQAIARAAGITRQTVHYLLRKDSTP